MLTLLIILSVIFMILGLYIREDKSIQISMLSIAAFFGIGGTYLSYNEGEGYYAYIPLSITIVSIVYTFYVIYLIINDKKDWSNEVEDLNSEVI